MTAASLSARLPEINITLVESANVPTIGVGESTVNSLRDFLRGCGADEDTFLLESDATIKLGNHFIGWHDGSPSDEFVKSFETPPIAALGWEPVMQWWYSLQAQGRSPGAMDRVLTSKTIGMVFGSRSPRQENSGLPWASPHHIYAYHVDAGKFAVYLSRLARLNGVRHVVDDVTGVRVSPEAKVEAVETAGHGDLTGDLFIDCTGYRGLLIGGALREPMDDWSGALIADRAVACRTIPDSTEARRPATCSIAEPMGWRWRVPLYSAQGNGIVYSSALHTDDEVEAHLRGRLGPDAQFQIEPFVLRFQPGARRRSWVSNVVAIGLSSGFTEPLEATGLVLIQSAVNVLHDALAAGLPDGSDSDFNRRCRTMQEDGRDYIHVHYASSARPEEYWRTARSTPLSSELSGLLEAYDGGELHKLQPRFPAMFHTMFWNYALAGLRRYPRYVREPAQLEMRGVIEAVTEEHRDGERRTAVLPDHMDYLTRARERALKKEPVLA